MFRELSRRDPEDRSYKDDIAWGKHVQARLRSARGDWADALVLIEEALTITRTNLADPRDLDNRWTELQLLLTKARVLAASPRREETQIVLDEVLSKVRQLPEGKARRFVQINCLRANAEILRKMDREKDAAAADAEADSLKRPEDDARAQQARQQARALNDQGVALIEHARAAGGLERRQNYDLAAEKYRAALTQNPGDPIIWSNLRDACSEAVSKMVDETGKVLEPDDTTVVERGLRCAVESAWMAWVLSEDAGDQERLRKLTKLIVARRSLAKTLRYDERAVPEALSLARENVREMKALVTKDPSVDALFLLADSYYGLGLMSEAAPAEGWEEEMRAAIVSGEQLGDREPNSSERRLWIGQTGSELADTLENHKRPGVVNERQHARDACQAALRLAKTPDDQEKAQSCIEGTHKE
jgi:tetratricopeptide (TPR) repeat protein